MSEKIVNIAKAIKRHRSLEISIDSENPAVARSEVNYNGSHEQFWILNKENKGGFIKREDITGFSRAPEAGNRTTITEDGKPIYKNSILGGILISNHKGKHKNKTPNGEIAFEIFNRTTYIPTDNHELAIDIVIQQSSDKKRYQYRSLLDILTKAANLQKEIDELNKEKEKASEQQAEELVKRIKEKKKEKKVTLEKAQSFIRKNAELRYQPILDPWQEEVKRSNIFDGTMAIDGGPGTGKTTSLIQRLKFLIDESIVEYRPNLTKSQKTKLFDQNKSWIFFSPSELLALYLKNNMVKEGLEASNEKVKVWANHKRDLIRIYKLVNSELKRPFLFYNKNSDSILFKNNATKLKRIVSGFELFYLNYQSDKLKRLIDIDVSHFDWKNTGKSIQNYIKKSGDEFSINQLIQIFSSLTDIYNNDIEKITTKYKQEIETFVAKIQVQIQSDENRKSQIEELLKKWKTDKIVLEEDEEDENELEDEQFDETILEVEFNFEQILFSKLKALGRKIALIKYDKTTRLSSKDKQLLKLIPELKVSEAYETIGQLAFFRKYFERVCKGMVFNMFREIPMLYKKYRRLNLKNDNNDWNKKLLEDLVKKDNNKRLHPNEQALLLYFINNLIKQVYKSSKNLFKTETHPYFKAFTTYSKPVIGVDEATDFHLIDLISIYSLGDPEISSVTFSGDVMQRMKKEGISSWNDLKVFIPKFEVKDLAISYRQSPTLLELAQNIYKKSMHQDPEYIPFMDKDDLEPQPLIFQSDDKYEKIKWIAKRINEIYRAYGDNIPSIAIFHTDPNQLESFAAELSDYDELADYGIHVKASRTGEVLGDKNTVRVFSIEHIKGLEFEAVFFYDLDKIQQLDIDRKLIDRYLYVGLSRATFYLAVTLENNLDDSLNYLYQHLSSEKNWKI